MLEESEKFERTVPHYMNCLTAEIVTKFFYSKIANKLKLVQTPTKRLSKGESTMCR